MLIRLERREVFIGNLSDASSQQPEIPLTAKLTNLANIAKCRGVYIRCKAMSMKKFDYCNVNAMSTKKFEF